MKGWGDKKDVLNVEARRLQLRPRIRNAIYVEFNGPEKLERKQLRKIKSDSRFFTSHKF